MIRVFFGSPGCGKTTTAVRSIVKFKKKKHSVYDRYFTNFDSSVSESCDLLDLGLWTFPQYSFLVVDESGIEYNNRKFKSLSQDTIKWFKLHRHFRCDVDFYSQSWEDTDVTILRLATEYWHVRRLGPFTILRKIRKFVRVDDDTKQIQDGYEFKSIIRSVLPWPFYEKTIEIFLRKPYYKYFDSFSVPPVPVRYADKAPTE